MSIRMGAVGAVGVGLCLFAAIGCSGSNGGASSSTSGSAAKTTTSTTTAGGSATTTAVSSAPSSSGTGATVSELTACTMPLTQDPYDGFHIGVPAGWGVSTVDGTIVVNNDSTQNEQAVVYPVLGTAGLTEGSFFTQALDAMGKQLAASGVTMTPTITSTGDQAPTATLSLVAGTVTVVGEARVAVLSDATAYGSSQYALLADWAPPEQFAADRATLAAIGSCYGPQPGALYQVMTDPVFRYAIPLDWSVQDEGQDNITIGQVADESASFLLTSLPPGSGVTSPEALLSFVLGRLNFHIDHVLKSTRFADQQTPSGATQSAGKIEFTGTRPDGAALHGQAIVVAVIGGGNVSGSIRLAAATTSSWNSVNGALIHIRDSIQHSSGQDILQWERLNRQQAAFAQQVQGFDYALTGVDLVHDTSTGATFEAPYDAWNPSGPDGPGYYNRVNKKLEVQTP